MLNRIKPPIMGLWNGVGGKIEAGETPLEGAIREVFEETGIEVVSALSQGCVTWQSEDEQLDGLHVFLFESQAELQTPVVVREGILDWKELSWILDKDNQGVPRNVPHYLPELLAHESFTQHITYEDGKLTGKVLTHGSIYS